MQEVEWWNILNYSCRFEGKIRTHRNENDRRLNKQDQTYAIELCTRHEIAKFSHANLYELHQVGHQIRGGSSIF